MHKVLVQNTNILQSDYTFSGFVELGSDWIVLEGITRALVVLNI